MTNGPKISFVHRSRTCVCDWLMVMHTANKDDSIKGMAVALIQNLYRDFFSYAKSTEVPFEIGNATFSSILRVALRFNLSLSRSSPYLFLYTLNVPH